MMQNGEFSEFPLFTGVKIIKDEKKKGDGDGDGERDEELGGQDLKKEFKLPEQFTKAVIKYEPIDPTKIEEGKEG